MTAANTENDGSTAYNGNRRSNYMIEERHTDQLDYNLAAQDRITSFRDNIQNRRRRQPARQPHELLLEIKDLLGGDYWADIDKFAERDFGVNARLTRTTWIITISTVTPAACPRSATSSVTTTTPTSSGQDCGPMYNFNIRRTRRYRRIGGPGDDVAREGLWRKGLFPQQFVRQLRGARLLHLSG